MKACKHLDYTEGKYTDCTIETCAPHFPDVRYWRRGESWTAGGNPVKVQFCGLGRGRINGVFQCYNPGEMSCYEPGEAGGEAMTIGRGTLTTLLDERDKELARLKAALAQAEQALRAVEWFNCGAGYVWCPWCRAVYAECDTTRVHDDSCSRQAALRAIAGEE